MFTFHPILLTPIEHTLAIGEYLQQRTAGRKPTLSLPSRQADSCGVLSDFWMGQQDS